MNQLKVLDVTLRDGGCVNDFNFGQAYMDKILAAQEASGVDIIEMGYIDENKSIFSREGKISITATGAGYETTKTIRIVQAAGGTVKRVQLSVSYTFPEEYKDLKFLYLHEIGSLDYIPVSQSTY